MDLNSTPFISYRDIETGKIELIEDAFGIYPQFRDVIRILDLLKPIPDKRLTRRLIEKIRKSR